MRRTRQQGESFCQVLAAFTQLRGLRRLHRLREQLIYRQLSLSPIAKHIHGVLMTKLQVMAYIDLL